MRSPGVSLQVSQRATGDSEDGALPRWNLASPGDQRQQRFAGGVVEDGFVEHTIALDGGQPGQHGIGRLFPQRIGGFAEKQSQGDQVGIARPLQRIGPRPIPGR